MALGHLMIGVAAGFLVVLALVIADQPLWQVALAYSMVGSLTVVTCSLLELWRMRLTTVDRCGAPGPLRHAHAPRPQQAGIKT